MAEYRYQLERGGRKYACPACKQQVTHVTGKAFIHAGIRVTCVTFSFKKYENIGGVL
jgi:hypothetical protein